MDATEAAVAHYQNVISRLGGFHDHIRQGIDIDMPMGRLHAGLCHFRYLPGNMLRLQQEDLIGPAQRRGQIVLAQPHLHGVRAWLQHRNDARRAADLAAQRGEGSQNRGRVVGEVIVDADAVGGAAQLQTATGVDKRAQRIGRIRSRDLRLSRIPLGGERNEFIG